MWRDAKGRRRGDKVRTLDPLRAGGGRLAAVNLRLPAGLASRRAGVPVRARIQDDVMPNLSYFSYQQRRGPVPYVSRPKPARVR